MEDIMDKGPAKIISQRTIAIDNIEQTQKILKEQGCKYLEGKEVRETFFKQPEKEVLRADQTQEGFELVRLQKTETGFDVVSNKEVEKKEVEALAEHYGVQGSRKKRVRKYNYGEHEIDISIVEGQGAFLTVKGSEPEQTLEELGLIKKS